LVPDAGGATTYQWQCCWEIMGATSYAQRKNKKTKIPDSQKDVRRRAKIGAQKSAKHKTAYRDCVT